MSFTLDMSGLPAGVVEEFRKGRHAKEVATLLKAPRLQDMVARAQPLEQRSIDGMGGVRMAITPEAYHYWGRRLGYACWSDEQFLREFERDNPNVRVKAKGTKIQSGYGGGTSERRIVPAGKYARI
jgi:hypothetical protein